jgi:hypothetical protein
LTLATKNVTVMSGVAAAIAPAISAGIAAALTQSGVLARDLAIIRLAGRAAPSRFRPAEIEHRQRDRRAVRRGRDRGRREV